MIGKTLGPYEILSPIGAGGMGEVWKARDTRLGRIVAIKKVKELHSERFKQEARSIAALNHTNICQLFDIGPDYLVLEYVDGKPLSNPLPEREAVRLAIQIATALEAAHKKGIVHRDLKPANIMVTDEGTVKLLDFGLAKIYEQEAASTQSPTADFPATQAGAVLGTVAYMSPEQAQGQPADGRSDIFSFGLVLYEMLSGRRAFAGESPAAIIAALLKEELPPLQASPSLDKIVRQCLSKQPSGRYQTISEVKTALEKIFAEKATITNADSRPSIAVLPFVNMSGDKEQEYFSDGLAEEIINALTKIPGLKVPARTSSFYFRGKETDIQEISTKLKVNNILEGSVRRSGNRIRITAQLINAADGYHLWSERYDRELTDVFAIQDEISRAIAEKFRVQLLGDRQLVKRHTENVEAYSVYLNGNYQLFKFTAGSMAKSKEYFDQAISIDPNYALAWQGLALYYWWSGYLGFMPSNETNAQCLRAVTKALECDETLAEAHSLLATLLAGKYDWVGSEREFLNALKLDPDSADVLANYSQYYLIPMQRLAEVITASRKALELDPLSPHLQTHLGIWYWFAQQYDRSIAHYANALEIDPQYHWAYMFMGLSYIAIERYDEGVRACETAVQIVQRNQISLGILGWAYARVARIGEAQAILEELQELKNFSYVSPSSFVWTYLALGEIDKGFDWMERAVDEHDPMALQIPIHPEFIPLRSHPRYHALLRKMNLGA
jgi:eukaryotic-like serine/threonine-protein kinase